VDVTGDLDVGAGNFTVAAATGNTDINGTLNVDGAITAAGAGHSLGTLGTDANVLTINGDDNNVGAYELDVQGDVNISGTLSLPGVNPNAVLVTDASGNIVTDAELAYNSTTNVLDVQGTVENSAGDLALNDNVDVTGNIVATGTIQSGSSIIIDGTTPGSHNISTTGAEDLTIAPGGGDLNVTGNQAVSGNQSVTGDASVNGNTTLGNNAGVDATTINGTTTVNQTGGGNGVVINESGAGDGLVINEADGGDGFMVAANGGGRGGDIDQQGTAGQGLRIRLTNAANTDNALVVNTVGTGNAIQVTGGNVDFDNNLTVDGNTVLGNAAADATTINGSLTQIGGASQVTFAGNVDATNGLDVTGASTFAGTLTQTGAGNQVTLAGNVDAQNGLDVVGGNLNVINNASVTGDLSSDGNVTLGNNAADAVLVNGTLTAVNTANLNGNVNLGDAAADVIDLNGTLTGTGGGHSLGAAITDQNVLTITGVPNTATNELTVAGDANVTGTLTVNTLGLTGDLDMNGNDILEVGDLQFSTAGSDISNTAGNVTINDDVDVTGDIVPTANATYNLGSDANRWAEVYVDGSSVHIGPANGEAGNTELALGYAANTGSINVNGGNAEITVDAAAGTVRFDPDADGTLNAFVRNDGIGINTGVGTDILIAQDGIQRNGGATETFSFTNSGGDLDVTVDGDLNVQQALNVTGAATLAALSGGGNQALYVDNTGAVQASNATAAQNASGVYSGSATIAVPNGAGTEAIANTNVTATSVIVVTRIAPAGPQLSQHISAQTAGVGFTVQFSGPVTAGDVINYIIINP
jgi:hypothetical protein